MRTRFLQRAWRLAKNPRMAAAYSSYLAQRATGRDPFVPAHGGRIFGYRRFNDFWSVCCGRLSPAEIALIRRVHGKHLFDVGGNYGVFTVALAREHPNSTIHTFEPGPRIFQVLEGNVRRNGLENVRRNPMAVSDSCGTVRFTQSTSCDALNRLGEDVSDTTQGSRTFDVQAITIDDYCQNAGVDRIAFLKIDVEGAEPKVLRGARNMLTEQRVD
ncbi:MAG TPA: FkbM family methyltransferase, partial [Tepidisphaeraceae bacterium]|nr:FkbM family methyltransferase [Tepidisphaeraceae bacterium]